MNLSRASKRGLSERGSTPLEFTLIVVTAITLAMVGVDVVSYLRSQLRLDEVSGGMASAVTQYQKLYNDDVATLFQTAQQMAGSVDVSGSDGATIITGISNKNGTPVVEWRKQKSGSTAYTSAFGAVGARPTNLPDQYALPTGHSVIAVEVFSAIHPWVLSSAIMGGIGNPTLRSAALYHPRASELPQIITENRP